jgi:hypothetical protein
MVKGRQINITVAVEANLFGPRFPEKREKREKGWGKENMKLRMALCITR